MQAYLGCLLAMLVLLFPEPLLLNIPAMPLLYILIVDTVLLNSCDGQLQYHDTVAAAKDLTCQAVMLLHTWKMK